MSDVEQTTGPAKDAKVIKRYTNRKLYDTVESRYVTLEEIAEMIKGGAEVKIVDNRSKEDLTSVTLAQIIFEEEKKKSKMPLGILRDIIRTGGGQLTAGFLAQVGNVSQRVATIKEEAEGLRDRLLRRESEEAAAAAPKGTPVEQAKDLMSTSQRVLEDWQKKVDQQVRTAVENITSLPALAKDVASLEKKIEELEKKLSELEKK